MSTEGVKAGHRFFEGPEKKVELAVVDGFASLRSKGHGFWESIVHSSRAQVISVRHNESFDAFLLSESSLFVYDSFVTMITCGRTLLVDAVETMLQEFGTESVAALIYERKNEHFPHEQPSSFFEDANRLSRLIDGRAVRFGVEHEHAVRLFHSTKPYRPDDDDRTLEVLMHGIDPARAALFANRPSGRADLIAEAGLGAVADGFELDEYIFSPAGYSLNGMRDNAYITLHVTPQRVGSYVSFETNLQSAVLDPSPLVERLVSAFAPESFDVVAFVPGQDRLSVEVPNYQLRNHFVEPLAGYTVIFQHLYRPVSSPLRAFHIPLGAGAD